MIHCVEQTKIADKLDKKLYSVDTGEKLASSPSFCTVTLLAQLFFEGNLYYEQKEYSEKYSSNTCNKITEGEVSLLSFINNP